MAVSADLAKLLDKQGRNKHFRAAYAPSVLADAAK